jgi:hypothetical protein
MENIDLSLKEVMFRFFKRHNSLSKYVYQCRDRSMGIHCYTYCKLDKKKQHGIIGTSVERCLKAKKRFSFTVWLEHGKSAHIVSVV